MLSWLFIYVLIGGVASIRDSKLVYIIAIIYLFTSAPFAYYIYVRLQFIKPFEREQVTKAIIEGEKLLGKKYYYTYYWYTVNGVDYKAAFNRRGTSYSEMYDSGDTIDVTYNVDDPQVAIPTFLQYWYINKDKEKYWLKIKRGEGRRNKY